MIPASGKIVVFDCDLPVKHAFFGLLEHDVKCAPIWDSAKLDFVGMLTVSDFIDILRYFLVLCFQNAGIFIPKISAKVETHFSVTNAFGIGQI